MNYTFARWSTELWTMTAFPQCKFFRLGCQHVSVQHKSSFNLMTFFLQGHKNEMDTIVSLMLFHLLGFSFASTVKACMHFRVLSRSKSPCWTKNKHFSLLRNYFGLRTEQIAMLKEVFFPTILPPYKDQA